MSEKKPTMEEILQRIDGTLAILKNISQDLMDISRSLKTLSPPSSGITPAPAPTMAPSIVEPSRSAKDVRTLFTKELEDMLNFEEEREYIIIKPRRFLGSENFSKIASIVRGAGGEYISAGKESHFRIPREIK